MRIDWSSAEHVPAEYANQLLSQVSQGEIFLTFAQLTPPVLVGDPEQQAAQARDMSSIPVKVIARLILCPERVEELLNVLGQSLEQHQRQQASLESEDS